MSIFNELKRRKVFKVGIAYILIAWLVAQALHLVFESFGTPDWAIKTVLVLLVAGFPLALFFAWAYEMTPEGIKRESEIDRSQPIEAQTGRKLNVVIIVLLVLAILAVGADRLVPETTTSGIETAQTSTVEEISEQSIAVLPVARVPGTSRHVSPLGICRTNESRGATTFPSFCA